MSTPTMNAAITPFTAHVPQDALDDLQQRLARTRFAKGLAETGWSHGLPEATARDLVARWQGAFDWRAWEAKLNTWPQFITEIDGQNIAFLHIRSQVATATPLILIHGWPGSVFEFLDVIAPLTDPEGHGGRADDAFHLVIPAVPGFGFSGPTSEPGWNNRRIANAFVELMTRLGYERFGTQGGDIGSFIAPEMARVAPDRVIGTHVDAATFGFIPMGEVGHEERATLTEVEQQRLDRLANWHQDGSGYFQIMASKPQTISYGLADSPVSQLAWIAEKFATWSDNHGGEPGSVLDSDVILAHAALYWFTETAASSSRHYWESMHSGEWPARVEVPTGVAAFAEDVAIRRYAEAGYNIVHWSDFERGGHFAALEAPDLFVQDMRTFFGSLAR